MQLTNLQRKIKAENVPSPHVFTKAQKLPSRNILTISPRTHLPICHGHCTHQVDKLSIDSMQILFNELLVILILRRQQLFLKFYREVHQIHGLVYNSLFNLHFNLHSLICESSMTLELLNLRGKQQPVDKQSRRIQNCKLQYTF